MNHITSPKETPVSPGLRVAKTMHLMPTDHEKREWSRMAQAAYAADQNSTGHRFSSAASLNSGMTMELAVFDALQSDYRAWLIDGTFPDQVGELKAALAQNCRLLITARQERMTEETRAESFRAQRDALAVKLDAIRTECETHADGAPDAQPRDKFANLILSMLD